MLILPFIVVTLLAATYLSSLNHALLRLSRAALQRRLDERGTPAVGDWLYDQIGCAILSTALLRTLLRMTTYILTLAALIGLRNEATVRWSHLILAGLVAAAAIWLTTIVIGSAVARHAGVSLVAVSLPFLRVVTWTCAPFTKAGTIIDDLIRRAVGPRDQAQAGAELLESIEDTQRQGGLDVMSAEILENVVEITNKEVSQIMTPRGEIEGIEFTNDLNTIRAFIDHAKHSRIPVYRGTFDNIIGILYLKDLIRYLGADASNFKLAPLLRQPIVVPETKSVKQLLTDFQHSEVHMAVVIDEYGGTAGLVTIEDVLEEIVGEIRDEHEPLEDTEPQLRSIDPTHAEVDGRYRIHQLNQELHLELPEDGDYDTLAGFVLSRLGRVPAVGEKFVSHNAKFTTLAATPTHVQRVGIELLRPVTGNGEK